MLHIYATGVRNGEYITGTTDMVAGTVMQVFGEYPPSKRGIEALKLTDIRDKLEAIDFFAPLSVVERKEWLVAHQTADDDLYLNDLDTISVRFVSIGGKTMLENYTEEIRDWLVSQEEPIPIKKVYELSAGVDKAKRAGRRNLIYRPDNWEIYVDTTQSFTFSGYIVNLTNQTITEVSEEVLTTKEYVRVDDAGYCIAIPTEKPFSRAELKEYFDNDILELIGWASPSVHKSLIQKIIRTRTSTLEHFGAVFSGLELLHSSFLMLLLHPGTFDASLGRFTSGCESALKRLGVSITEDSSVMDNWKLLQVYAMAYIVKKVPMWRPSMDMVVMCVDLATEAYNSTTMYEYKTSAVTVPELALPLNAAYFCLRANKSFHGDIHLLGHIALNKGRRSASYNHTGTITVPLVHCIDHHNIRDIAWHYPYELLVGMGSPVYDQLFRTIWEGSSSFNSRKDNYNESSFLAIHRRAEQETWLLHTLSQYIRPVVDTSEVISHTLDNSWLSALVGPHEIDMQVVHDNKKHKITVLCTIHPSDINEFVAVYKPARDYVKKGLGEFVLSIEDKAVATKVFKTVLRKGVSVNVPPSLQTIFPKLIVRYEKRKYYCNDVDWLIARNISKTFKHHLHREASRLSAIATTGEGIEVKSDEKLAACIDVLDHPTRNRLLMYIDTRTSKISLNKIGLDGNGTEYQVAITDTAVCEFLCKLCVIYPGIFVAVPGGFKIKHGPAAWTIYKKIRDLIAEGTPEEAGEWPDVAYDNVPLYEHQQDAVTRMLKTGDRHIIFITVGLGKTRIAMHYMYNLIEAGRMPEYCVYTVPDSAIKSIVEEFKRYNFRCNVVIPLKKKGSNHNILPGCINIIDHDHLKREEVVEKLSRLTHKMMFVVDEFHLALRKDTKRTGAIVALAKVTKHVIAMTGTLVTDSDTSAVITWLGMIAQFEVTYHNYWCAMSLLVSNKIATGVIVERQELAVELLPEEKEQHDAYLASGHFNEAVTLCHTVLTEAIIQTAKDCIATGEGVFIVAASVAAQDMIAEALSSYKVFCITSSQSIYYDTNSTEHYDAVITTPKHSTGYTLTKLRTMIQPVFFSNQATRTQLEGRTNRLGQKRSVEIITLHTGVLSYVMERYDAIRSLAELVSNFATDVNM